MKESVAASSSSGGCFGTLCLLFWLAVHYGAPLGTTWGGISVHVAAYYALLLGVVIPLGLLAAVLVVVLIIVGVIALVS